MKISLSLLLFKLLDVPKSSKKTLFFEDWIKNTVDFSYIFKKKYSWPFEYLEPGIILNILVNENEKTKQIGNIYIPNLQQVSIAKTGGLL